MKFTTFIPFAKIRTLIIEEIHHLGRYRHSDFQGTCLESIAVKADKTQKRYVQTLTGHGGVDHNLISRSHLENMIRHVLNRELKKAA